MVEAAKKGDVFITTTGNRDVITREDFEEMQDGVLLANAGHFDVEVNLDDLDDPPSTASRPATASKASRWPTAAS